MNILNDASDTGGYKLEKVKLKKFRASDCNLQTKILWWLMLLLSLSVCGAAVYGVLSFSVAQVSALLIASIITALVNKYQFTIPKTKITLTTNEFIIFWATIWLGIPGGVLLAAVIFGAQYKIAPKDKSQWLIGGFANLIATCAAGNVFYLTLKILASFSASTVAENALHFGWLAVAVILMATAHSVFSRLLNSIFYKLGNDYSGFSFRKNGLVESLGKYSIGIVAALVLHFVFLEFGLYFGFVLLPLTVLGHLAYRIHISRFEQKTREITEASRIHLATVEALATAIDARDQVGIGHVRRTQIYAVGIGEQMNLSAAELQALNTGALLHDIGKLAVPDHILNKPGRLTPAEMEKMKIHASVGASILENINFPYPVVPTIKYHHESWDGSGYPEGLKGENIPLTARVMAVADAFDTLRGARPYRPAVSRDDARQFLITGAGTQFDPKIVDVFLRNLSKFEAQVEAQGYSYTFDRESTDALQSTLDNDREQSYVEQIKRANREVFTLYELARVFNSSLHLQETLSLFVKKIGDLVPFDTCIVYLMDESEDFARAVYIEGENKNTLKNKQIKPGEGATGYVLKKRQSVHEIEAGLDFTRSENKLDRNYTAMASLPLIADEKLLGAVSLYSCDLKNYEEEHIRLLETVSRIASDALAISLEHAESESRAMTDPMTDLPNARSLQLQFEKEAGRAERNGTNFQMLMLDLDGFKAVNDTFGHKIGDKMLKELAKVMNAQLRDYDFLARYAGDEFVVIVPETDAEEIKELSCRIEKAVNECVLPISEDKSARVGISIGAASYPADGETLDQVLTAADKAMYSVKATRKTKGITAVTPPLSEIISCEAYMPESFVELDESHIVSTAIN